MHNELEVYSLAGAEWHGGLTSILPLILLGHRLYYQAMVGLAKTVVGIMLDLDIILVPNYYWTRSGKKCHT